MSVTLKARNYYDLTYSAIPDNKIEQVLGEYTKIVDTEQSTYYSTFEQEPVYVEPHSGEEDLPLYSIDNQSYYEGRYVEDVTYSSTGSGESIEKDRTEKVWAKYDIELLYDVPFTLRSFSIGGLIGKKKTREGDGQTGASVFWTYFDSDTDKLYAPYCINMSGAGTSIHTPGGLVTTEDLTLEDLEHSYSIDSVYDGRTPYQSKFRMVIHLDIAIANNVLHSVGYSIVEAKIYQRLIDSFQIEMVLWGPDSESVEYEYHVNTADYVEYPLRVEGNEYVDMNTTWHEQSSGEWVDTLWAEWISNDILNKYKDGKFFVSAKVKMSYLIENNIDINSEIIIKDINNEYVSRKNQGIVYVCVFKVKNIEYNCENSGYGATIVLLEDRIVQYTDYVINSNNIRIVTSDNIKVILRREIT